MQVAQELADCISLPDGTIAQLSVARSLAKADSISIEPYSEDDWEILESRADLAEETILKQVFFVFSFFSICLLFLPSVVIPTRYIFFKWSINLIIIILKSGWHRL